MKQLAKLINEYQLVFGGQYPNGKSISKMKFLLKADKYSVPLIIKAMKKSSHDPHVHDGNHLMNMTNTTLAYWKHQGVKSTDDVSKLPAETSSHKVIDPFHTVKRPQLSNTDAQSIVKQQFCKPNTRNSNALAIVLNQSKPNQECYALAQRCAKYMHYPTKYLARIFAVTLQLQYSKTNIVCGAYQYACAVERKADTITSPARYYLGILSNQLPGDANAIVSQLKSKRTTMPYQLKHVLDTSMNAGKYDALIYRNGWNNYKAGWNAKNQPITLQGSLSGVIRRLRHFSFTGYPDASNLRPAVIVSNALNDAPHHKYAEITPGLLDTAYQQSTKQEQKHCFSAVIMLKPWQAKNAPYIDLGEFTDNDKQLAQKCVKSQKWTELYQESLKSFHGVLNYLVKLRHYEKKHVNADHVKAIIDNDAKCGFTPKEAFSDADEELKDYDAKQKYIKPTVGTGHF